MPNINVVLGFDFGTKKIGVAVGQSITQTAKPLAILKTKNGLPNWDQVKQLLSEWGADAFVVGLPLNMDGTEQPITKLAKKFGRSLEEQFKLPVYFIDERLTTIAAKDQVHSTNKGQSRFDPVDSVSAQLIVESWLRSQ